MRWLPVVLLALFVSGCATVERDPAALANAKNVRFVCEVSPHATDVHVGITIFGNTERKRDISKQDICDRIFPIAQRIVADSGATLHPAGSPSSGDATLRVRMDVPSFQNFMIGKDVPLGTFGFYHDRNPFLRDPTWVYLTASAHLLGDGPAKTAPFRSRWIQRARAIAYWDEFEGKWETLSADQNERLERELTKLIDDSMGPLIAAAVLGQPIEETVVDREYAGPE